MMSKQSVLNRIVALVLVTALFVCGVPPIEVFAAGGNLSLTIPYDATGNIIDLYYKTDTFTITWSSYSGANCYKFSIKETGASSTIIDEVLDADTLMYEVDVADLDYDTSYTVYVGAYASATDSYAIGDYWTTGTFITSEEKFITLSSYDDIEVNCDKQTITLAVESNTTWGVFALDSSSDEVSWITVSPESGNGDGTVTITIYKNSTTKAREAEVHFKNGTLLDEYVTVYQSAAETLELSETELAFSAEADETLSFKVTSSENWEIVECPSWLKCDPYSKTVTGTNTSSVDVTTISVNNTGNTRTGVIGVETASHYEEIEVTQESTEVDVPDPVNPVVTALTVTPAEGSISDTFTFIAKAEDTTKVVFYVDNYLIGSVTSSNGTFSLSYDAFQAEGTREVTAYPCDADGNEIRTAGAYQTASFTIESKGKLEPVNILSEDNRTVAPNTAVDVSWSASVNAPSDVNYNIYVRDLTTDAYVGDVLNTDACSFTIPKTYFASPGQYRIEVYVLASGYAASDASSINLTVEDSAEEPAVELTNVLSQITMGEPIPWDGLAEGTDLTVVTIAVTNPAGNSIYFRETSANALGDSYDLANLNGGKIATGQPNVPGLVLSGSSYVAGSLDMTQPGTYKITAYAMNGAVSAPVEDYEYVVVSPAPVITPLVTSLTVNPASGQINDTFTFTARATNTSKVAFYVDTYHLATVTGMNGVFTFTHNAFTSTGSRTAYAYPCDANGQPVMTEGCYVSAAFTIAKAPRLDPVTITSPTYRTSLINNAIDLNWYAPANAPVGTQYNINVYTGGSKVGTVITTTTLSCVIPANYFSQEGEYMLEVLAAAEGWESGPSRSVTVSVRTAQPTLEDYALDRTTVSLGGTVRLSGFINGNGGLITKVSVTVLNTDINDGGTIWTNQYLNAPYFDLSSIPVLDTANPVFKGAGNYKIRVFVQMQGADGADMLGNASLSILTDARLPLPTPVVTGSDSAIAGDNYQLSWIPVANADYYELTIDGTSYKEIIKGNAATIPGKTLKNLTGAQTATTLKLRLVAHSNDTDTWLPSSAAVKTITVLPEVQSRAMILGVTMKNYTVVAGSMAEFTVTTTTDVTAIRMKDGAGSFIIGTWNTGYVDKNGERIWTITQQINDPGVNNQRVLTFYSMIGDTEYNKCDIGFTCIVTAAIGSFNIVSPAHESKQTEHRDLSITWNAPANVAVDSYIVRVYHGDECILQQDVPAQNPAPVVIPGALLVRDNEAYQVRITARKIGHAESTAVSRFTLICPHDNTYQPVETMKYTYATPYIHTVYMTTRYDCADCGQKNVKNETKDTMQGHTWVNLDNGGRVCNLCWYMEGVVEDTKEYKLNPEVASSKERVYSSVGADGKPYGIQYAANGAERQIFDTDVVTVLGTKGLCYFVKYPVGNNGEFHFGFVEQELVDRSFIQENPTMILTPNQIYVQNMRNELYKLAEPQEKVLELFVNEYGLAQSYSDYWCENYSWGDQIERNIFSGKGLIMNNLKRLIQNNDYISDINYEVLNSIICKIPSVRNNEWDNLVLQYEKYLNESSDNAEKLQFIIDFTDTADDLLHFNDFAIYADTEEKITKRIAQLEASGFAKDHNFNLVKGSKWDEAIDSAKNVSAKYLLEVLRAYNNYYNFSMNAELEYFDVLREICYGDQSLQQTITMLEAEYLEEKTAAMNNLKKYLSNVLPDVGLEALLGQFFGAAFTKINVIVAGVEIFIDILASTTGLDAAVNAKEIVAFYSWMVYRTKYDIGNMLKNYDGSAESADKIATYYQVYRGMQIYFIEQVICILEAEDNEFDATIDGDKVAQLQREIQWLLLHDITDWAYNPYNFGGELGGIPNVSDLTSNYYMNILLNGYSYSNLNAFDGIMENWLQMVCADQEKVARMIELMKDFNKSEVNKMYLLHFVTEDQNGNIVKNVNENTSMYHQFEYYSVLYVNKAGIGLYITRPFLHMDPLGKTKAPGYTTCYTFLSASKVEQLLDANTPDQRLLFCVDNTAYGEIANFINWKYTSYVAEAIEFNITQAQYYNSLNLLLGEKYCKYSIECIELDDLVAATFNLKMDFWKDFHLWWSFEDLVKKAGTGRIFTTKYKR